MDILDEKYSSEKTVLPGGPPTAEQPNAPPDPEQLLESLERCLSAAGHEVRTPLALMRLGAELILRNQPVPSLLVRRFLSLVAAESARMVELVDNWLARELLRDGYVQWNWGHVRLSEVCERVVPLLEPLLSVKAIRLRHDVEPVDLWIRGDAGAIQQLVLNLLHDGCRHLYGGGMVLECIESMRGSARWVVLSLTDSGGERLAASSADPERRFRSHPCWPRSLADPESDLGLAIARSIVSVHGGYMRFRTAPDQGTAIMVHLQADLAEPQPATPCQLISERGYDA